MPKETDVELDVLRPATSGSKNSPDDDEDKLEEVPLVSADHAPTAIDIPHGHPDATCADDQTVFAALPQELSMFTNPSSVLDCFWLYINFCYYLGLFPFRTVRDKRWRCTVQKFRCQQILSAILHLFFIIFWIKKWRTNPAVNAILHSAPGQRTSTKDYFNLLLAITEVSYVLALLFTAWTKALVFQHISNSYHNLAKFEEEEHVDIRPVDDSQPLHRLLLSYALRIALSLLSKRYVVGIVLCAVFAFLGIKDWWEEYDEEIQEKRPLFGDDGYFVISAKELFYLDGLDIPLPIGYILGIFYLVVSLQYSLLINLGNLFYGILALMLADLGNNFENLLALPDVTGKQIVGEYSLAKDFVKYINEELGLLTLFMVLSAVPYYATVLPHVLNNEIDKLDRIIYGVNLAFYGLVIYLSSTLAEKMKRMHEWFAQRESTDTGVSSEQQRIVMEELAQDSAALSAFGFFSVSYPTIGKILQLLVTYGFIKGEGLSDHLQNVTGSIESLTGQGLSGLGFPA